MIKHAYIILPPSLTGGRQTVVSIAIHGDAPTAQGPRKQAAKEAGKHRGGRRA